MRNDLQHRSQHGPQWSPRNANNPQAEQPEEADRNRVLQLSDSPVLESGGGDADMIGCWHCLSSHAVISCGRRQIENLCANSAGKAGVAPGCEQTYLATSLAMALISSR